MKLDCERSQNNLEQRFLRDNATRVFGL